MTYYAVLCIALFIASLCCICAAAVIRSLQRQNRELRDKLEEIDPKALKELP